MQIGMMFNKIIPFEFLAQLPRPFVHRLRDIRIKQLEEANKQQANQMQQMQNQSALGRRNMVQPKTSAVDPAMFNGTAIDDLIDELT